MEAKFYEVGDCLITIIFTGDVYEYYARRKGDKYDVFRFQFGCDERFEQKELENLYNQGYFKMMEEE